MSTDEDGSIIVSFDAGKDGEGKGQYVLGRLKKNNTTLVSPGLELIKFKKIEFSGIFTPAYWKGKIYINVQLLQLGAPKPSNEEDEDGLNPRHSVFL